MSTPAYRITFSFATFIASFPEFGQIDPAYANSMFLRVQAALVDNTGGSPITDDGVLQQVLFLAVAHLLTLYPCGASRGGSARPPGNITSASQGSVSTGFEVRMPVQSAMAAWWVQTAYGLEFWTVTAPYRSARYFPAGNSGIGHARAFNSPPVFAPQDVNTPGCTPWDGL